MDTRKGAATSIGERLEGLMLLRGENANEAAKRCGVGYATVHGLIGGERVNPSLDVLEKLARGYGVTVGWLVDGDAAQRSPFLPVTAEDARALKGMLSDALDAIERWEGPTPEQRAKMRKRADVKRRRRGDGGEDTGTDG